MKAKVTRIYTFNDKQIEKFMVDCGYTDENGSPDFTDDDLDNALDSASADDLECYGSYDSIYGQDIDIDE